MESNLKSVSALFTLWSLFLVPCSVFKVSIALITRFILLEKLFPESVTDIYNGTKNAYGNKDGLHQLKIVKVIQAPTYARTPINANWNNGHFQLFVSRFTTASVDMHCMANT